MIQEPLKKLRIEPGVMAQYYLIAKENEIFLNDYLHCPITIRFTGNIFCVVCGRKTSKVFGQGYCFPCFKYSPENSPCIIYPELCRGHLGEGRDPNWELENHVKPHIVYLAWSSDWKVGVTRETQIPTRWLDQGATLAIPIARTPNRYLAGLIEVSLKRFLPDKTDWRKMILNTLKPSNPIQIEQIKYWLSDDLKSYLLFEENVLYEFKYPFHVQFSKLISVNLQKTPSIEGKLIGMKGQYLIFSDGRTLNIRNHTGYEVSIKLTR